MDITNKFEVLPLSSLKKNSKYICTDPCVMGFDWIFVKRGAPLLEEARKFATRSSQEPCLIFAIMENGKKKVLSFFKSHSDLCIIVFNAKKCLIGGYVLTPYLSRQKIHVKYKKGEIFLYK